MSGSNDTAARHIVIVRGGLGGLRTIEALRRRGFEGPITLVGAEIHRPYDRPPLSKAILRGEADESEFGADLTALGVTLRLGQPVVAVDTAARTLRVGDGTSIGYDRLVISPGVRPRWLPGTEGMQGVHVLRTVDDAHAVRAAAERAERVVILGAGFIGCEVATSLRLIGAEVHLVETEAGPLAQVIGPDASREVARVLSDRGVAVHAGCSVDEVVGEGAVTGVRLSDGTDISTDLLVLGIGAEPHLEWLAHSGIEIANGVVCDATGRTTAPDVWALGDAAAWRNARTDRHMRTEHWTSTVEQAEVVAADLVHGAAEPLMTVPYVWSDLYDVKIQILGTVDPADDCLALSPGGRLLFVFSRENRISGAVGFSAARAVMGLRRHIAEIAPIEDALATLAS